VASFPARALQRRALIGNTPCGKWQNSERGLANGIAGVTTRRACLRRHVSNAEECSKRGQGLARGLHRLLAERVRARSASASGERSKREARTR
jgi:hypothetical protein